MRGIAALAIVVYHSYQHANYPYGTSLANVFITSLDAGVDLFFVLSGLVIFLPFARASIQGIRRPSLPSFLLRRAARIAPLYYVLFLLVWAIRYDGYPGQITDLWQHLTFTHVFDAERIFWTIGPAWSIANEVIYYLAVALVAGPLVLACHRISSQPGRIAITAAVPVIGLAASIGWKAYAYSSGIPFEHWPAYFGPLARFDGFALGMLLAIMVASMPPNEQTPRKPEPLLITGALIGTAAIVLAAALRQSGPYGQLYFHTLCGLGFFLIVSAVVFQSGKPRFWSKWLAHPKMVLLGSLSYGVYLWHEPILIEFTSRGWILQPGGDAFPVNAVLVSIMALLAASGTYALIERPAMRWASKRMPKRSKLTEELALGIPASGAVPPRLREAFTSSKKPKE